MVVGFEHGPDAERFLADLRDRLAGFGLDLHPDKTRVIAFGRNAARDRAARGAGKPATLDFLGFTYICSRTRRGGFLLARHSGRRIAPGAASSGAAISGSASRERSWQADAAVSGTSFINHAKSCGSGFGWRGLRSVCGRSVAQRRGT